MEHLSNLEAEGRLLGTLMRSNDVLGEITYLKPDHFYEPIHGRLFAKMLSWFRAGRAFDDADLATELAGDPSLVALGGAEYLFDTAGKPGTRPGAQGHATTIKDLAVLRQLVRIGGEVAATASCPSDRPVAEIAADAARIMSEAVAVATPAARRARLAFTADTLEGRPVPPREWIVRNLIPASNVTMLSGDGGTGKSTLLLQLLCASALNMQWLGLETRPGRSLYLSAEDDADELHRRLDRIAHHYDRTLADLGDVKLWPVPGGAVLAEEGSRDKLQMTPLWDELRDLVTEWRPSLIVLDSLADVFSGNEINRAQVRQFVTALRDLAAEAGAAIIILAHPSVEGMRSGSGISGSTAWHNSVRSRLYLEKARPDDGCSDDTLMTLSQKKANYAATIGDLRLQLVMGAFNNLDGTGRQVGDLALRQAKAEETFLRLLDRFNGEGRRVSHMPGQNHAPAVFADCEEARGFSKPALKQAMDRLFKLKIIAVSETGPPSKRRFTIARSDAE